MTIYCFSAETDFSQIKLTTANNSYGGDCVGDRGESHYQSHEFPLQHTDTVPGRVHVLIANGLEYHSHDVTYYFCVEVQTTTFSAQYLTFPSQSGRRPHALTASHFHNFILIQDPVSTGHFVHQGNHKQIRIEMR